MSQLSIEIYNSEEAFWEVWKYGGALGPFDGEIEVGNELHDGGMEFHTLKCMPDRRSSIITTSKTTKGLTGKDISTAEVKLQNGESHIIFQRNPGDFLPTALRLTHRRRNPHISLTDSGIKMIT